MNIRRNLLWIDGLGAALAGVLTLALMGWLSELYDLPRNLLLLIGVVNLLYGSFSLPLARRRQRPLVLIQLLAVANLAWALFFCFRWAYVYSDTASLFGLAHFVGEGIWVGGLGVLEWRWRESLQTA